MKVRGRFYIQKDEDGWTVVDSAEHADGGCLSFDTRREAEDAATFAREYVRKWGDIDFQSFPYSLEDEPARTDFTLSPITTGAETTMGTQEAGEVSRLAERFRMAEEEDREDAAALRRENVALRARVAELEAGMGEAYSEGWLDSNLNRDRSKSYEDGWRESEARYTYITQGAHA